MIVTGFTASAFDLLHPGHMTFLLDCLRKCDKLVVALQTNPNIERSAKNAPVESMFERWFRLANFLEPNCSAFKKSYLIIPYDTERDLLNILHMYKPSIRFLGDEYEDVEFTGHDIPGIEFVYFPRSHDWSTSELRSRIENVQNAKKMVNFKVKM